MTKPIKPLRAWRERQPHVRFDDRAASLEDLAPLFGVDRATLGRWERGRIPAERVLLVESVTGIPREKLRPDLWKKSAR